MLDVEIARAVGAKSRYAFWIFSDDRIVGLFADNPQGVVDAYHTIGDISIPVIVRLQGTNAEEAKELIDKSGLEVFSAITLQEAAELVKKVV